MTTKFLLDANVLMALFDNKNANHSLVKKWFSHHIIAQNKVWLSCAITQMAYLRILSLPSYPANYSFSDIQQIEPKLLSAPGPVGLINWQFLLVSFISIVTIPYVQPQMTTRIFVAKNDRAFTRSTMGLAVFALLVILPTLFVGLRAVQLQHEMGNITGDFLLNLISHDAPAIFFAIFIVGVLASNMSTTDSQLLAIGTEWRSAMLTEDIQANATAKSGVKTVGLIVAILALLLAQTSFQSLILFAINSFIATSLLLPIVVAATYQSSKIRLVLSIISVVTVCIFSLSMFNIVPKMIVGYRIELFLYAITGFCLLLTFIKEKK